MDDTLINRLIPEDDQETDVWDSAFPRRDLPEGAYVTRFGPSFGKHLSLAAANIALISQQAAYSTGGVYIVRIEDTDGEREVPGALAALDGALAYLGLESDETDANGALFGPYRQSNRAEIYRSYVRTLLRRGLAYPCFTTRAELRAIADRQAAAREPIGYHGEWAVWRDAPAARVHAQLDAGTPYVLRYRSENPVGQRFGFRDVVRGEVECEAYYNDVVILKASDRSDWLPTYHFAHIVDDHLMQVNLVVRGEEWIPSTPLHIELNRVMGFEQVRYAHIASLMRRDGDHRRRLSGKKDPDALVVYFQSQGYPAEAVRHYLRGLYNPSLADLTVAQARTRWLRLEECVRAQPTMELSDLRKKCAQFVADLSDEEVLQAVEDWAAIHDTELADVLRTANRQARAVLALRRANTTSVRRDLACWSEFRSVYGFALPGLFVAPDGADDERLGVAPDRVGAIASAVAELPLGSAEEWYAGLWRIAEDHQDTPGRAGARAARTAVTRVVRVALTGSTAGPDLHEVAGTLGAAVVGERLRSLVPTTPADTENRTRPPGEGGTRWENAS
ncbi:glutamate--tRNA ligase [Streptomyces sp. 4N509B]|uniref:glutamate--tRNA ligase n=1 Tax=Streptomyces sp. 4N509B TaxID=3457413 RepID=UPI003FD6A6C2